MARVEAIAAAVGALAMVATPINRQGGAARRVLSSVVVGAMGLTTFAGTARSWGAGRAAAVALTTAGGTAWIERLATRSGRPFGRYAYTSALRPQVAGVPAIVPIAWFGMAVPAREAAHAALGQRSSPPTRIVGGALALTAWDLFLDPQMVSEGYWRWARGGRYRGIPATNFLGWFATGLGVMALLELVLPPRDPAPDLAGQYGFVAAMETIGFAAFFRDRLVAAVGGAGMLPWAVLGVFRTVVGERR